MGHPREDAVHNYIFAVIPVLDTGIQGLPFAQSADRSQQLNIERCHKNKTLDPGVKHRDDGDAFWGGSVMGGFG